MPGEAITLSTKEKEHGGSLVGQWLGPKPNVVASFLEAHVDSERIRVIVSGDPPQTIDDIRSEFEAHDEEVRTERIGMFVAVLYTAVGYYPLLYLIFLTAKAAARPYELVVTTVACGLVLLPVVLIVWWALHARGAAQRRRRELVQLKARHQAEEGTQDTEDFGT